MENKAYLKDCIEGMKEYPDKHFDLAIVDPPYGIDLANMNMGAGNKPKHCNKKRRGFDAKDWDKEAPTDEYFNELKRVSKNQIIWGGNYFDIFLSGVIIWYKLGSGNFKEGEFAKTNINTFKLFSYSRADAYINDCDIKIHPTQKPVALYKWLLQNYAKEGDTILDTHLGSGSIAIACYDGGFELTGMELDKEYYDAATKRLETHKQQLTFFNVTQQPLYAIKANKELK